MFKSAVFKLTIYYVGVALALSLIFSVVLFHFASVELREGLNNQYNAIAENDHDIDFLITDSQFNERSSQLFLELLYFNLAVLVISGGVSYFLAKRTLRPIEIAHQAQIRFSGHASHELRTPLAAIRADTESVLMLKDPDSALLIKTLKNNLNDTKRIEELANHLLDVARFRSRDTLAKHSFDLKTVADEAARQAKRTKLGKKAIFKLNTTSVQINGDSIAVGLIMSALIDNSLKYSPNKPKIEITVKKQAHEAVIQVKDNGAGIDQEQMLHIFEPFYRAQSGSTRIQGYGLGLSLAKEIVDSHRGKIDVNSQPGRGTTVIVKLPLS